MRGSPTQQQIEDEIAHDALEDDARLAKRPVAWRVKAGNGWVYFDEDEKAAYDVAEATGAEMQGLYVRDGR